MKLRGFLSLKKKIKPVKITITHQILLISYQNQTGNHKRQKQSPGRILWKNVLKNFAKFTENHLCWSFFFNKVLGLRPVTLLKKRLQYSCFPANFAKFSKGRFFIEHLRRLILKRITISSTHLQKQLITIRWKFSNKGKLYKIFCSKLIRPL